MPGRETCIASTPMGFASLFSNGCPGKVTTARETKWQTFASILTL
jgi:hypothetical protein